MLFKNYLFANKIIYPWFANRRFQRKNKTRVFYSSVEVSKFTVLKNLLNRKIFEFLLLQKNSIP